ATRSDIAGRAILIEDAGAEELVGAGCAHEAREGIRHLDVRARESGDLALDLLPVVGLQSVVDRTADGVEHLHVAPCRIHAWECSSTIRWDAVCRRGIPSQVRVSRVESVV